jgi:hypothetical protein
MRAALLAVVVAFGAAAAAGATTAHSGLFGTVERGPISPVCIAGQPCTAPAAGAILIFTRGSAETTRVTVRLNGSYRIRLAPGTYTVRASYRRLEPTTVRVPAGAPKRIDFSIDTGIR